MSFLVRYDEFAIKYPAAVDASERGYDVREVNCDWTAGARQQVNDPSFTF